MDEARQIAAQCWCEPETQHLEMDTVLAEAVARQIANWMSTAAMLGNNVQFYQNLLDQCAQALGPEAFTADDGSRSESPIRLKIPELVRKLVKAHE